MTTFPALEAALEEAAQRHYGRRRLRRWRVRFAAPALALACVMAVLVLVLVPAPPGGEPAQAPAVIVPERTLVLSHALTAAPREPEQLIGHNALAGVAAAIAPTIPYPPEGRDTFDFDATPPGPYDMASINYRDEVRSLLEYRAACQWVGFWDFAWRTGNEPALAAATTVLDDVAHWPSQRDHPGSWPALAAAAAARDPAPLQLELDRNCRSTTNATRLARPR